MESVLFLLFTNGADEVLQEPTDYKSNLLITKIKSCHVSWTFEKLVDVRVLFMALHSTVNCSQHSDR